MISVVIPSLGGDLSSTFASINSGTVIPDEIIVCLPNKHHSVSGWCDYENISIVYSGIYGQVNQRIYGFKVAKGDYILQLDDDIIVSLDCLKTLIYSMSRVDSSAVSPCWYNSTDNNPLHQPRNNSTIMTLYYWIINGRDGYNPGKISLAGTNFGVNPSEIGPSEICVDWQPGGCILHKKKNLILKDYYPFVGKSYCEDIVHSFFLRKAGVRLIVNTKAKCMTHMNARLNLRREIIPMIKQRIYFVKLANLSIFRMSVYYAVYIIKSFFIYIRLIR